MKTSQNTRQALGTEVSVNNAVLFQTGHQLHATLRANYGLVGSHINEDCRSKSNNAKAKSMKRSLDPGLEWACGVQKTRQLTRVPTPNKHGSRRHAASLAKWESSVTT